LLCDFTADPALLRSSLDGYRTEQLPIGATSTSLASATTSLNAPPARIADQPVFEEQRLSITLDAFKEIARRMQSLPGEKNLVWMTAGFPPPEDRHDFDGAIRQLRAAEVRLYPVDARGLIACIPLPCPPSVNLHIEMMEELAEQTGGRAFHDNNGLSALVRSALDEARQGYLLTYSPNNYRRDGSAHRVELKTSRKGIELHYRPGYVADSPAR
jgi:VWFA-related protein